MLHISACCVNSLLLCDEMNAEQFNIINDKMVSNFKRNLKNIKVNMTTDHQKNKKIKPRFIHHVQF